MGKIFVETPQNFVAVGDVLENIGQIFEKLWLENAIKVDFFTSKKFLGIPLVKRQVNGVLEGSKQNFPLSTRYVGIFKFFYRMTSPSG